jgi:mono/diheme cytochrome c family protein
MLALARADDIPNLKDPDMITAGSQLFQEKQCAYCHGQGGSGAIRLAGRSDLEAAYIFETIAELDFGQFLGGQSATAGSR